MSVTNPRTSAEDRLNFIKAELDVFIGPHEFNKARAQGDFFVLDVRSQDSFNKGHLPAANHIPRAELKDRISEVPKDKTVVTYCSDITCFASKKAAVALMENGYEDVRVLYGGFRSWKEKGFEVNTATGATQTATPPAAGTN